MACFFTYTEHNLDNVKYHGNPFSGSQDWCGMDINNKILPCHLLMYLHLLDYLSTPIITKYGTVSMPGHYVLIHSVAETFFKMFLQLDFIKQIIQFFG